MPVTTSRAAWHGIKKVAGRGRRIHRRGVRPGELRPAPTPARWQARRSGKSSLATNIPAAALRPRKARRHGRIDHIVVATDAPVIAHQLKRLARRAASGSPAPGASSGNGSGDIFMAFSTANPGASAAANAASISMLSNRRIDDLFEATVFATEEAVINAMVAAETMIGRDDHQTSPSHMKS